MAKKNVIEFYPDKIVTKSGIINVKKTEAAFEGIGSISVQQTLWGRIFNYGTVLVTIADSDKAEALPLIRRFYNLGFNIEATAGTAQFLKENGIRTRVKSKISSGSTDIPDAIRAGHIAYVINTSNVDSTAQQKDGYEIRRLAIETNTTIFTSLDTVRVLLDVLEDITITISTIDA